MHNDPWLHRWLPLVLKRAGDTPVLEIGCGSGEDSETLVSTGLTLIALDLSEQVIAAARKRVPTARFLCRDVREPFPLAMSSIGVVVASLSLHYFPWAETEALIHRVREVLRPGGLLLCRLNSTNDHNFGASGHTEIEANYYLVNGEPKRFFDKHAIDMVFREGWRMLSVEEQVTNKYAMPKALWEVILEKDT
ncbi:MAG: class I SAM-dependent methyltransferase [Deltaproteobacteria bacterium]|nr:class I SAM-dependent methyltransferase [Deltaproteobacteria bacterium]